MKTLQELLGQEVYDLLYKHYDKDGALIGDMEDVFYCDDDEIDQDRIPKLEALLIPITDAKSSFIPIEAGKLLAAWGSEKAIEYFESCINGRIDRLGNLDPHRLHANYDTTYERMTTSILHYYARCFDKSAKKGEKSRRRIFPLIVKIISLSEELTFDMGYLVKELEDEGWREYLPVLKDCYLDFIKRPESDLNKQWNLPALKSLLQDWEPGFLRENPE